MEFTWITGSLAWFNNVFLQELFGVKPGYGGLVIDPCLPTEWQECADTRDYRGARYHIQLSNPYGTQQGNIEITVDGNPHEGNLVPIFADGQTHEVKVLIRKKES